MKNKENILMDCLYGNFGHLCCHFPISWGGYEGDEMVSRKGKRFLMILQSAGFIESSMIRSQNVINFAYIAYLIMKREQYE